MTVALGSSPADPGQGTTPWKHTQTLERVLVRALLLTSSNCAVNIAVAAVSAANSHLKTHFVINIKCSEPKQSLTACHL